MERISGRGRFIYLVFPSNDNSRFAVTRRLRSNFANMQVRCHCGKWVKPILRHGTEPEMYGGPTHAGYDVFEQVSLFVDKNALYLDARDAQAVADKLNKGIPLNWPLWAALGFATLQIAAIVAEAIW